MAYDGLTVEYMVKTSGDRWFIPERAPDATEVKQIQQCEALSPDGIEKVAT
jgi:hypothetical protein